MPEPGNGRVALAGGGLAGILASTCCVGPLVLVAEGVEVLVLLRRIAGGPVERLGLRPTQKSIARRRLEASPAAPFTRSRRR
jgi:hypothetical protein